MRVIFAVGCSTGSRIEKSEVVIKEEKMARNASRCGITCKIVRYLDVSRRRRNEPIVLSTGDASNCRCGRTGSATRPRPSRTDYDHAKCWRES